MIQASSQQLTEVLIGSKVYGPLMRHNAEQLLLQLVFAYPNAASIRIIPYTKE